MADCADNSAWNRPFYRVVGVAGNVREAGLDKAPIEAAYFGSVVLVATSFMASYIPARRAAGVDPMLVLRMD